MLVYDLQVLWERGYGGRRRATSHGPPAKARVPVFRKHCSPEPSFLKARWLLRTRGECTRPRRQVNLFSFGNSPFSVLASPFLHFSNTFSLASPRHLQKESFEQRRNLFPFGRVDLQATIASGQPTCAGSRPCRRQEEEESGREEGIRRPKSGSGALGSLYGRLRFSVGRFLGGEAEEDEGNDGKGHRLRWCRRDFRWIADVATRTLLLGIVLFVTPGTSLQTFHAVRFKTRGSKRGSSSRQAQSVSRDYTSTGRLIDSGTESPFSRSLCRDGHAYGRVCSSARLFHYCLPVSRAVHQLAKLLNQNKSTGSR